MSSFNSQLRFPALAAHVQDILNDCFFLEEIPPAQQMNEHDDQDVTPMLSLASTASTLESYYDMKSLENDSYANIGNKHHNNEDDNESGNSIKTRTSSETSSFQRRANSRSPTFSVRNKCPWETPSIVRTMKFDDTVSALATTEQYHHRHKKSVSCRYPFVPRDNIDYIDSTVTHSSVSKASTETQWHMSMSGERPVGLKENDGWYNSGYSFETSRDLSYFDPQEMKYKTRKQLGCWRQLRQLAVSFASSISVSLRDNPTVLSESQLRRKWARETKNGKQQQQRQQQHAVNLTAPHSLRRRFWSETNRPRYDSNAEAVFQNDLQPSSRSTYTVTSSAHLATLSSIVNRQVKPSSSAVQDIMSLMLREEEHEVLELLKALTEENKQKWSGIRDSLCLHRAQNKRHCSSIDDCEDNNDNSIIDSNDSDEYEM